jgi:hypothetical protein
MAEFRNPSRCGPYHPRVAMQILRHAQFSLTMEIYTLASSKQTQEALKRLGESLEG